MFLENNVIKAYATLSNTCEKNIKYYDAVAFSVVYNLNKTFWSSISDKNLFTQNIKSAVKN